LRDTIDRFAVIRDFQGSRFRVMDVPEDNGVNVDRYGVLGKRLLRVEGRRLDAFIDDGDHLINDRDHQKHARSPDALQFPRT
jgi:hypothetical protein